MGVVKRRPVPKTGDVMDKKRMSGITDEREIVDNESEVIREKRRCPRTSDVINEIKTSEDIHEEEVMDKLNNPTKVSISFSDERIDIGEALPNNNNQLNIKTSGKKGVIYSAGIVNEITNLYGLDFTNRTSITFLEVEYIENEGCNVAIINAR